MVIQAQTKFSTVDHAKTKYSTQILTHRHPTLTAKSQTNIDPTPTQCTDTIDYIVVMQGKIDMELEPGGEVVTLHQGDVMVQRGTVHNWVNPYDQTCVLAVILIHAKSVVAGGKTLAAFG